MQPGTDSEHTAPVRLRLDGPSGLWHAMSPVAGHIGTGTTPAEALQDLASFEGFDAGVVSWLEHQHASAARDGAILEQLDQQKRLQKKRKAAEQREPNIIPLRRAR